MIRKILSTAAMLGVLSAPAFANGDAEKGERVFNKCKACHAVGEDAKNRVGPVLNGIVGSPAASNPDFNYSDAMIEAGENGLVWDEESLSEYLAKPRDYVEGTKMSFAGLRKEEEIENVIAYLQTYN
jgi:cytochrome c